MREHWPPYMSFNTLAEYLDSTPQALRDRYYKSDDRGGLPEARKLGGKLLFKKEDVDALMDPEETDG